MTNRDTITLRNKKTGELITIPRNPVQQQNLATQPGELGRINVATKQSQTDIAKRGTIQKQIGANLMSPNPVKRAIGAIGAVGAPLTMLEAGIANPALAMQSGQFNPITLAKESIQGFTGQKLGEYGDVFRNTGMNRYAAAGLGLTLGLSPFKALSMAKRSFGAIAKMSDKGIMRASGNLLKAIDESKMTSGAELDKAYRLVNDVPINTTVFASLLKRIPKSLQAEIDTVVGGKGIFKPTVEALRQVKQIVGKYKPSIFGKEERGLAENIEGGKLNELYSHIKMIIETAISSKKGSAIAQRLSTADEAFSKVSNASDYIQKTITDPTLLMPTKGGAMAKKVAMEGDISARAALNILKSSGARKSIMKALNDLESFNRWQAIAQFGKHAVGAATFGGAIGGAGGYVASKMYNREGND